MMSANVERTRLWGVSCMRFAIRVAAVAALSLLAVVVVGCVVVVPVPVPAPWMGSNGSWVDTSGAGEPAVRSGPALSNVASLPVDASGEGTLTGQPTGEADAGESDGSFVLVLDPAPLGLPARTTVNVGFDKTTKVYRGGKLVGDPLSAMNQDSSSDADPSSAGSATVRFHVVSGRIFAERIDLSDDFSSDDLP
jgi:hypothetical protein